MLIILIFNLFQSSEINFDEWINQEVLIKPSINYPKHLHVNSHTQHGPNKFSHHVIYSDPSNVTHEKLSYSTHHKDVINVDLLEEIIDVKCSQPGKVFLKHKGNFPIEEIFPGLIIVSGIEWEGCSEGLMEEVISNPIKIYSNLIEIDTKHRSLHDLFHNTKIRYTKVINIPRDELVGWNPKWQKYFGYDYNYDWNSNHAKEEIPLVKIDDNVIASCSNCYAFVQVGIIFELDVSLSGLKNMKVLLRGQLGANAEISIDGIEFQYEVEKMIKNFFLIKSFNFMIGYVPVNIDIYGALKARFEISGEIAGTFVTGLGIEVTAEVGAQWSKSNGWENLQSFSYRELYKKPEWTFDYALIDSRIYIIPMFKVKLYKSVGLQINVEPYLGMKLSTNDKKCQKEIAKFQLYTGLDATLVIPEVDIPLVDKFINKFLPWEYPFTIIEPIDLNCSFCTLCIGTSSKDQDFTRSDGSYVYYSVGRSDPTGVYLTIHEGINLPDHDFWNTGDPYATVKACSGSCGTTYKTQVIDETNNPKWEREFDLGIVSEAARLEFRVYDDDPLDADDFIGSVNYRLQECGSQQCNNVYRTLSPDGGQIKFSVSQGSQDIYIGFESGQNLPATAYVKVTASDGGSSYSTTTKTGPNPIWNEMYSIGLHITDVVLTFQIYNGANALQATIDYTLNLDCPDVTCYETLVSGSMAIRVIINRDPDEFLQGVITKDIELPKDEIKLLRIKTDTNYEKQIFYIHDNGGETEVYAWTNGNKPNGPYTSADYVGNQKVDVFSTSYDGFTYIAIKALRPHTKFTLLSHPYIPGSVGNTYKGIIPPNGINWVSISNDDSHPNSDGLIVYLVSNVGDGDLFIYDELEQNITYSVTTKDVDEIIKVYYSCPTGEYIDCMIWSWPDHKALSKKAQIGIVSWFEPDSEINYWIYLIPLYSYQVGNKETYNCDGLSTFEMYIPAETSVIEISITSGSTVDIWSTTLKKCKVPYEGCYEWKTSANNPIEIEIESIIPKIEVTTECSSGSFDFLVTSFKTIESGQIYDRLLKKNEYHNYITNMIYSGDSDVRVEVNRDSDGSEIRIYASRINSKPTSSDYEFSSIGTGDKLFLTATGVTDKLYYSISGNNDDNIVYETSATEHIPLSIGETIYNGQVNGLRIYDMELPIFNDTHKGLYIYAKKITGEIELTVAKFQDVSLGNYTWGSFEFGSDKLAITNPGEGTIYIGIYSTINSSFELWTDYVGSYQLNQSHINQYDIQDNDINLEILLTNKKFKWEEFIGEEKKITEKFINLFKAEESPDDGWNNLILPILLNDPKKYIKRENDYKIIIKIPQNSDFKIDKDEIFDFTLKSDMIIPQVSIHREFKICSGFKPLFSLLILLLSLIIL